MREFPVLIRTPADFLRPRDDVVPREKFLVLVRIVHKFPELALICRALRGFRCLLCVGMNLSQWEMMELVADVLPVLCEERLYDLCVCAAACGALEIGEFLHNNRRVGIAGRRLRGFRGETLFADATRKDDKSEKQKFSHSAYRVHRKYQIP